MFKASQIGCHLLLRLLLGDVKSKLIILLSTLILLNEVIGNDIRPSNRIRLVRNQIHYTSVLFHYVQVPVKHSHSPSEFLQNNKRISKKDAYRNDAFQRFKRDTYNDNEIPINQTSSFKSDKNNHQQQFNAQNKINSNSISSPKLPYLATNAPKNQEQNRTTKEIANVVTTTLSSINDGSMQSTATNIGYKYNHFDRNEMRKQNRLNKESNLASWNQTSWNGLLKLIFLLIICTAGTTGNIFVISSIMVVDNFQMQGNIYIVSLALAQLLITIIALPATCIEIMAVIPNYPPICHLQWLLTQFTLFIIVFSFMFISIENCSALRGRSLIKHNLFCTKFRIVLLVLLTWLFAGLITYTQHKYELAPAFCQHELNKKNVWLQYHLTIAISIVLSTLITMICFLRCAIRVKRINYQFENNPLENNWQLVVADGELVKVNIIVYLFTFFTWLPLCILGTLSIIRQVNLEWLNAMWWLAWSNSCFYPFVYAFFNQNFSKTFFKLFFYCCCKTHLQFEGKTAINLNYQRRTISTAGTNNMELRVHMIPGFNMNPRTRDDYCHMNTGFAGSNHYNVKNQRYGTVTVGRHTRTIQASDGGLGFGGIGHHNPNKWHSRIDSDHQSGSNYSGNFNRFGSRNYSHGSNYSSHLIDAKDYSSMYDRSFGSNNQKYYI